MADRAKFLTLRELVGDKDMTVVRCMSTLEDVLFGLPARRQVSLDWVSQGIGDECEGLEAIGVVEDIVKRFGAAHDATGGSYRLLADLISERILRLGFKVSASQFLTIQFICGWVRAVGVRHAEAANTLNAGPTSL